MCCHPRTLGALRFEGKHVLLPAAGSSKAAIGGKLASAGTGTATANRDDPPGTSNGGATADREARPEVQARTDTTSSLRSTRQEGMVGDTSEAVPPNKKHKKKSPLQSKKAAGPDPAAALAIVQSPKQGQETGRPMKRRKKDAHAAPDLAARGGGAVLATPGAAGEPGGAPAASNPIDAEVEHAMKNTSSLRGDGEGAAQSAPEQAANGTTKKNMSDTLARALARLRAERPGGASAMPKVAPGAVNLWVAIFTLLGAPLLIEGNDVSPAHPKCGNGLLVQL